MFSNVMIGIIRNFITRTLRQILLGWSEQGSRDRWGM